MNEKRIREWESGTRNRCPRCGKDFKHCPCSVVQADRAVEQHKITAAVKKALKKMGR